MIKPVSQTNKTQTHIIASKASGIVYVIYNFALFRNQLSSRATARDRQQYIWRAHHLCSPGPIYQSCSFVRLSLLKHIKMFKRSAISSHGALSSHFAHTWRSSWGISELARHIRAFSFVIPLRVSIFYASP